MNRNAQLTVAFDLLRISRLASEPQTRGHLSAMKKKRAIELQALWGDKPCPHPALAKEYDQGSRTGNFICTQCGIVLSFRQRAELKASRSSQDPEE